jgi:hypothetical protein
MHTYLSIYLSLSIDISTHAHAHAHTHTRPGEAVGGRHAVARVEGEEAQGEVQHAFLFQVRAVFNQLFRV